MSVFAQYVPYKFAHGTWDERRDEVRATGAQFARPLLLEHRQRRDRRAGAGSAGHRAEGRPHRRTHLSGRVPAALHVGQPALGAHADAGRLSVRSVHAPRRQRDRHQRAQCGHGGAEGHRARFSFFRRRALCYAPPYMSAATSLGKIPALKRGIRFRDLVLFYVVIGLSVCAGPQPPRPRGPAFWWFGLPRSAASFFPWPRA